METNKISRLLKVSSHLIAGGVTVALAAVLAFNAGSRLLETRDPEMALRLNPMNPVAHLQSLRTDIAGPITAEDLPALQDRAARAIAAAPLESRGFSTMGILAATEGDIDRADALFEHALAISQSEPTALRWKVLRGLQKGETEQALLDLRLLSKRWPNLKAEFENLYQALLGAPGGVDAAALHFRNPGPDRRTLMSDLRKTPAGALLASQLLQTLAAQNGRRLEPEIEMTITALMRFNNSAAAQNLFLFTLTQEQQAEVGNIYNSRFRLEPSKGPLDWGLLGQPGVDQQLHPDGGLRLIFKDAPMRFRSVVQTLLLQPGTYRLSITQSAIEAKLPDPIQIRIECQGARGHAQAELRLREGTTLQPETFSTLFEVPDEECAQQTIFLANRVSDLNWINRYKGEVLLHEIRATRVGN